jgi:hypothetical protein
MTQENRYPPLRITLVRDMRAANLLQRAGAIGKAMGPEFNLYGSYEAIDTFIVRQTPDGQGARAIDTALDAEGRAEVSSESP